MKLDAPVHKYSIKQLILKRLKTYGFLVILRGTGANYVICIKLLNSFMTGPLSYKNQSSNSKNHLNRNKSSVLSEFTSKPLQKNSFNSNSHNSKNHLNRTNFWLPWTYFSSCNSNFGFGVYFFDPSIFNSSKFKCFNSNAI